MRTVLRDGALRLDLNDLTAAVRAAVWARLVRRLRTLALRARHERALDQREMATPLALRRARNAFLRMTSQTGGSFSGVTAIDSRGLLALRVEVAQPLELREALIDRGFVLVRS